MPRKSIHMILLAIAAFAAMGYPAQRRRGPEEPIATPIVGGMITSSIAVLILLPVLFMTLKERQLRRGTLRASQENDNEEMD
jgi:copper/silver efflux system protein